jgi:hypothetical protein
MPTAMSRILSGGQQQRVALARSLAPSPEILFLDEPFSALDAFTRGSLQRDVRRIAKEFGITLVLVTHDLAEAVTMAERAVVLSANPGRISEIVPIDLENRDDLRTPEYAKARGRLAAAYENAAGRGLAAGCRTGPEPRRYDDNASSAARCCPRPSESSKPAGKGRPDDRPVEKPIPDATDWDDEYFPTDFTRRQTLDMFAAGGLMAALGPLIGAMSSPAFASAADEVVRIGYLPITDATALLVAHGMGYFKDEGLRPSARR